MTEKTTTQNGILQYVVIGGLIVAAFFGAYRFASARNAQETAVAPGVSAPQASQASAAGGAGTPACACCGGGSSAPTANGVTGAPVEGTAKVSGGIQAIGVKVGTTYSPNIIKLKAGIPAEITFGQGGGCTGQVISQDLGFQEDLTSGPKLIQLPALKAGTYSFSCGMGMVFGKIVVE